MLELRQIDRLPGFHACLKLQHETWGKDFTGQVPSSVLMIAQRTGGLVLGAYAQSELVGFVWGISGWKGQMKIHWSDMLAVKKRFRGQGIGYALKLKQREILKRRGVKEIYWTFDPLQTLNAHFNLEKLGAVVREYCPNLYGRTRSPLHAGLDTDRFLATWDLQGRMKRPRKRNLIQIDPAQAIVECHLNRANVLVPGDLRLDPEVSAARRREALYLEITPNLSMLRFQNSALARQWQHCVRTCSRYYFSRGFAISGFTEGIIHGRKGLFYVLEPDRSRK
jgi:predicted GNAT superfamily acetyltransferase